jgi:hypothetical protein
MDVSKMKSPGWSHAADNSLFLHFSRPPGIVIKIRNFKTEKICGVLSLVDNSSQILV